VEYELQHGQYPMIQPMFVHLNKTKTESIQEKKMVSFKLTSFAANSMCLSFISSHLIMNKIDNISTNWSTKNGRQYN
jgi:hypothetical protein